MYYNTFWLKVKVYKRISEGDERKSVTAAEKNISSWGLYFLCYVL